MAPRFDSFAEFWPFYVREHRHPLNRALHFIGTLSVLACVGIACTVGPGWVAALAPICGYGAAWFGHFVIQKNRPATFRHPFYSLLGDFVMCACIVTRRMSRELEKSVQ